MPSLRPSRWTNARTGDPARWGKQTAKCGIDLVIPYTMRASHHVEIVEFTSRCRRDDVIALGNQDDIPIMDCDGFIKFLASVYTLKGKAIGRLNMMVIGFLEVGLMRWILGIVFMWRKRGPVTSRSDDLDNDQALRFLVGIQDVLDAALRVALTPSFYTHIFRANHTGWKMLVCGRSTRYSDLRTIGGAFDLVAGILRQIEGIRSFVFKDADPLTDLSHRSAIQLCTACTIEHDQSSLSPVCRATKRLPSRQLVYRKRDVLPACLLRGNVHRTENSICLTSLRFDKHSHICSSLNVISLPKQIVLSCSHQGRR